MARRRGFGEVERRGAANKKGNHRGPDARPGGGRFSRTLATRMDAEAWLATERSLIDRDRWTPPPQRRIAEARKKREASYNTVKTFADRYLRERGLRPTTVHNYQGLLATRINPYFA